MPVFLPIHDNLELLNIDNIGGFHGNWERRDDFQVPVVDRASRVVVVGGRCWPEAAPVVVLDFLGQSTLCTIMIG